jgi:DnaJ-class molecular chaperone
VEKYGDKDNSGLNEYIECPECGGSGYDPIDAGQCTKCLGVGEIPAES